MWDKIYNIDKYVYGKSPNDFLKANFKSLPKGKTLLLAEGEGRNAVFLAKHGFDATAVDISHVALQKAKKLADENGVEIELICEDLTKFDMGENRWDSIISIFCHLPSQQRADLYKKVQLALKPKGTFLLEGYTPKQLKYKTGGPPTEDMMVSKEILLNELPKLEFAYLKELDREIHEGINHHGLGAVVQAIGFKK